jgi:hypothetical protein
VGQISIQTSSADVQLMLTCRPDLGTGGSLYFFNGSASDYLYVPTPQVIEPSQTSPWEGNYFRFSGSRFRKLKRRLS